MTDKNVKSFYPLGFLETNRPENYIPVFNY
jgi:hypothetical protein